MVQLARILRRYKDKIPEDFKFKDPPTVIYTRCPTIGQKIFNYKRVIDAIHSKDWKSDHVSCHCTDSKFIDKHHKHIVTGDLRIIANKKLRNLLLKGPTYREPVDINWIKVFQEIQVGIKDCQEKWAQIEKVDLHRLDDWSKIILDAVQKKIEKLKNVRKFYPRQRIKILDRQDVKNYLTNFQKDFVLVPTGKASNNIAVVCKQFYIKMLLKEVGFFDIKVNQARTYQEIHEISPKIIDKHMRENKDFGVEIEEKQCQLPILLWIPKMHKNPSKQRFIAASHSCTTKNSFLDW